MSIFKKLILKEWFTAFLGSFITLLLLVTVANLIAGLLRSNVSTSEVLINFLLELPSFLNKIIPISCLTASMFSINKLQGRNELTAIFASGFSRRRMVETIIQAALIVAFVQFTISSYVGPFAKKNKHFLMGGGVNKFRNLKSKGLRASTIGSGLMWLKSSDYFFSFASFDQRKNIISNLTLYSISNLGRVKSRISAPTAIYQGENRWKLKNGTTYKALDLLQFPQIKQFKNKTIFLEESPEDFLELQSDITTLNITALYSYIDNIKSAGINTHEYEILFYDKISSAIICIIFALLACRAIFYPNRRGSSFGKNLLFIFVFTIFYWLVHSYLLELGKSSKIHPIIACFGVGTIFSLYISFYFLRHKTLR